MGGYGRQVLEQTGDPIAVLAELEGARWKAGGITFDWSLVTAVTEDTTLDDGTIVKTGDKYVRYGTVVDEITQAEVQTIDLSGGDDPTGGTWELTIAGETIEGLAHNVSAATLQAAIRALSFDGTDAVTVGKTGFVYTITFPHYSGNVATVTVDSTALTSGGTVTVTIGTTTQGVANQGKFGPVDTTATDGRQAMARGETYVVNETVLMSELGSDHIPVFEGGLVWQARLLVGGTNQPTLANLLTALPELRLIKP
jgi:hypothetical protein